MRNETVEDVANDIERYFQIFFGPLTSTIECPMAGDIRKFVDRLRRAHERDRHALNVAKAREALKQARRVLHCAIVAGILKGEDAHEALNVVTDALSAPPRNCDVGTPEEQSDKFEEFCKKQGDKCALGGKGTCPMFKGYKIDCGVVWAQLPYEETRSDEAS